MSRCAVCGREFSLNEVFYSIEIEDLIFCHCNTKHCAEAFNEFLISMSNEMLSELSARTLAYLLKKAGVMHIVDSRFKRYELSCLVMAAIANSQSEQAMVEGVKDRVQQLVEVKDAE